MLPSAPGYVGTFHAPGIAILEQFGVPQALAAGYTIVLHAALWLPVTLLGAYYMLRESISWSDIDRAAQQRVEQPVTEPITELAPERDNERDDVASGVSL
ncbi:MAG: hypothetical protein HC893_14685 [Chloroflexaceae bacterium]|nr:hypothetical protein [Chloroflexaceae bacterium]